VKNVTREIAKDLLPLYVAGEVSEDSRVAVEEWLREDPELVRLAAMLREDEVRLSERPPSPRGGQAALAVTKALLRRRSWLLAMALLCSGLPLSFAFDSHGVQFFMLRDAPRVALTIWIAALGLWIAFAMLVRRLRVTGL
jgi:anti-sigma factor RsiW